MAKRTEEEVAAKVVKWLTENRWDVYQEVTMGQRSCDIVARRDCITWSIEVKTTLNFAVLAQAWHWRRYSHRISIAVPTVQNSYSDGRHFAFEVMRDKGIGWLTVGHEEWDMEKVRAADHGKLFRAASVSSWKLDPEHKTFAMAGTQSGARWTPFQRTCKLVREAVEKTPGITMKGLINEVDHHYANDASAKGSLAQWIKAGVVEGVEAKYEGRFLRMYPVEVAR